MNYKLLTPGPLTTTKTVKEEMLFDRCTWDDDYKGITQKIRKDLLEIGNVSGDEYTVVLMQGSGSFGVESVLTSTIKDEDKALIITNGAYGERIVSMVNCLGIDNLVYSCDYDKLPDKDEIENILKENSELTHVIMVHCETTTGILNPIEDIAKLCEKYNKSFIVDAMSSFGGIPIDIKKLKIDYLISSANKCIQGVPGFSFIIANTKKLLKCEGVARSVSLDLYSQWKEMDKDGKWRFTSPTHVVAAFSKALDELREEGGVQARYERYKKNNELIRVRLKELGIEAYIDENLQSPIITTFFLDKNKFEFGDFYKYIKERGFVIYPGKLTYADTFRVGNIGEIYREDIEKLCSIIKNYMEGK